MLWLQMSREDDYGGGEWDFKRCVWTPTRKRDGHRWAYWDTILNIEAGDVVLHLRGAGEEAHFVGYSIASTDGFITRSRPPEPGQWGYAGSFYKAMLKDFSAFVTPLQLATVFQRQAAALRAYYLENRAKPAAERRRLFFVIQSGRLQCQNGAYLTEVDGHLSHLLFSTKNLDAAHQVPSSVIDEVDTHTQMIALQRRVRQKTFSDVVRQNYGDRCAFPDCDVAESGFLVGTHIARWTADEDFSDSVDNGLCFCLMHRRAFERGLFTVGEDGRIFSHEARWSSSEWAGTRIAPFVGQPLRPSAIPPAPEALRKHWERIDLTPG